MSVGAGAGTVRIDSSPGEPTYPIGPPFDEKRVFKLSNPILAAKSVT